MKFLKSNVYKDINKAYYLCSDKHKLCHQLNNSLKNNFEYYTQEEEYDNIINELNIIEEKILNNKLYKELIEGELETQINILKNKVIIIEDCMTSNYLKDENNFMLKNIMKETKQEELVPLLNDNGKEIIISGKKLKKQLNKKFYPANEEAEDVFSLYKYRLYQYKLPQEDLDQIQRLEALNLMLDDNKLNDILEDINNNYNNLVKLEDTLIDLTHRLEHSLVKSDKEINIIEEYARYLP